LTSLTILPFNAVTTCVKGQEYIGIFAGAIDFLFRCFWSFMADPETLTQLGDAKKEAASTTPWSDCISINDPDKARIPRDTMRRDAGALLALNAAHFLLRHEFTHLFRGHQILLNEEFSHSEFLELPTLPLTKDENRVRRALELDADHGAAAVLLEGLIKASRSGNLPYLDALGPEKVWALCIAMVFHILWTFEVANHRDGKGRIQARFRGG
jgi:hypothetical protein